MEGRCCHGIRIVMSGSSVLGALRLRGVLLKQQSSFGFYDTVRRSFDFSLPLRACSSCTFPSRVLVKSEGWEHSEVRCTVPRASWECFLFIGIKEALRGECQLCPRSRQTFFGFTFLYEFIFSTTPCRGQACPALLALPSITFPGLHIFWQEVFLDRSAQ